MCGQITNIFGICLEQGHRRPQTVKRALEGVQKLLAARGFVDDHQVR